MMSSSPSLVEPTTVVITLGGQAQVVTLALDGLLAAGETFAAVLVLHFSPTQPRVKHALRQLGAEFTGGQYRGQPLHYRHLAVSSREGTLPAIRNGAEAEAVWQLARDLLGELKLARQRLHLCIAGGHRILALTLTSAAMLQCDHRDRLWHLYTPRAFLDQARDGALLHAPPEAGVTLIPIPLVPWGAYFPTLRTLAQPAAALAARPDPAVLACCAQVWAMLTPRQQEVVEVLAQGLLPQEAAERLGITLKTLDTHKTQILAECRVAWRLPEAEHLTYHFLREHFGAWLTLRPPS